MNINVSKYKFFLFDHYFFKNCFPQCSSIIAVVLYPECNSSKNTRFDFIGNFSKIIHR